MENKKLSGKDIADKVLELGGVFDSLQAQESFYFPIYEVRRGTFSEATSMEYFQDLNTPQEICLL